MLCFKKSLPQGFKNGSLAAIMRVGSTANNHQRDKGKEFDGKEEVKVEEKEVESINCSLAILAMAEVCIPTCPDLYTCLMSCHIDPLLSCGAGAILYWLHWNSFRTTLYRLFLTDWGRQNI